MRMESPERKGSARDRVLQAAETLFHERGYSSVTMQDIAKALGMRQASLYYHAPGGKEELFVLVMERSLDRHRTGLEAAIAATDDSEGQVGIERQLTAVATWLIEQPPVNLFRIIRTDMGAIDGEHAQRLSTLAFRSIFEPVVAIFEAAQQAKTIREAPAEVLAGSFLSVMDGIWYAHNHFRAPHTMKEMAKQMIDVFLHGILPPGE